MDKIFLKRGRDATVRGGNPWIFSGAIERNDKEPQFCDACFSGDYPIELTDMEGGRRNAQLSLLAEVA